MRLDDERSDGFLPRSGEQNLCMMPKKRRQTTLLTDKGNSAGLWRGSRTRQRKVPGQTSSGCQKWRTNRLRTEGINWTFWKRLTIKCNTAANFKQKGPLSVVAEVSKVLSLIKTFSRGRHANKLRLIMKRAPEFLFSPIFRRLQSLGRSELSQITYTHGMEKPLGTARAAFNNNHSV